MTIAEKKEHLIEIFDKCLSMVNNSNIEFIFTPMCYWAKFSMDDSYEKDISKLHECIKYTKVLSKDEIFKKYIESEKRVEVNTHEIVMRRVLIIGVMSFRYKDILEFKDYLEVYCENNEL